MRPQAEATRPTAQTKETAARRILSAILTGCAGHAGGLNGSPVVRGQPAVIRPAAEGRLARLGALPLEGKAPGRYALLLDLRDEVSGRTMEVREPFSIERPVGPH